MAAAGIVNSHAKTILCVTPQRTAVNLREAPTQTIARNGVCGTYGYAKMRGPEQCPDRFVLPRRRSLRNGNRCIAVQRTTPPAARELYLVRLDVLVEPQDIVGIILFL